MVWCDSCIQHVNLQFHLQQDLNPGEQFHCHWAIHIISKFVIIVIYLKIFSASELESKYVDDHTVPGLEHEAEEGVEVPPPPPEARPHHREPRPRPGARGLPGRGRARAVPGPHHRAGVNHLRLNMWTLKLVSVPGEGTTRAFSLLTAPTSAFPIKNLLRQYAKRTFKQYVDEKL